jgi:uncharacterized LabA/DUF88 family protein
VVKLLTWCQALSENNAIIPASNGQPLRWPRFPRGAGFVFFMAKIYFFIDGFNFYHAVASNPKYHKYKWVSLDRLCRCFLTQKDAIAGVEYFTTLATWDPGKVSRHKIFIKAQENEGVVVTYGEFKRKDRRCRSCRNMFSTFEEKQTDVNIALRLFQLAFQDKYDKAIIISGDTDLIPAIKVVRSAFPSKQFGVIIPIGRASEDLKKQADFFHKMKETHLASSTYPDKLTLSDGAVLRCPATWK